MNESLRISEIVLVILCSTADELCVTRPLRSIPRLASGEVGDRHEGGWMVTNDRGEFQEILNMQKENIT